MLQRANLKFQNPIYGQLVIGPPGSGKTTYCYWAQKFYKDLDRKVGIVNLDPANENMNYEPIIDVMNLITVEDAMEHTQLGPNGALMFCIEYLEKHFENWLLAELRKLAPIYKYFIFDCPGQIELYTHHTAISNIFQKLERENYHLVTINLIDSHYCSEPTKFIATLIMALNMMLRMGLPHINILSKADLLRKHENKLHFNLDFYTDVLDLNQLLETLNDAPSINKYNKLNAAICSMIEDYGLVSFQLLDVKNANSMIRLNKQIDKANGYIYRAGEEQSVNTLLACAVGAENESKRDDNDFNPYRNND